MIKCQTHMFRKIIILYNNIIIVVTGVVKSQTNIIIYNYMACIAFVAYKYFCGLLANCLRI